MKSNNTLNFLLSEMLNYNETYQHLAFMLKEEKIFNRLDKAINEDISPWIVSKVKDMSAMFQGVAEFNHTVNGRGLSKRPFWFRFGVTYK
jgi:hypothetical protein